MKSATSTCCRGFVPLVASTCGVTMGAKWSDILALAEEMIGQYHLNADQSESLEQCAEMFNPETSQPPIVLIHGVLWNGVKMGGCESGGCEDGGCEGGGCEDGWSHTNCEGMSSY